MLLNQNQMLAWQVTSVVHLIVRIFELKSSIVHSKILGFSKNCNKMKMILKFGLMGLKVHQDGIKRANYLEWWNAIASMKMKNVRC